MSSKTDIEDTIKQLISLSEAAKTCGMSASHLRLLVRQKKAWGTKIGRNWFTTEAAVNEYLARDH